MTDMFDLASEQEEQARVRALEEQTRRANLTGKTVADSAEFCADCGDDIPLERRQAMPGCIRCINCEQRYEKRMQR